jgi:hypothetical protein
MRLQSDRNVRPTLASWNPRVGDLKLEHLRAGGAPSAAMSDKGIIPRTSENLAEWFTVPRFMVVLFGLLLVTYPQVFTGSATFFYRDFVILGYPWAHFQRECFWAGELPFWNPYNHCGTPFLGIWSTLSLYPLALFYLILPLSWAMGVFCLLHMYLAGIGTFVLARRWTGNGFAAAVAGVAITFHGMTQNNIQWPNYCAALGWMPWVVLTAEAAWQNRDLRKLVVAGLVGAMQMLAGVPEIILLTWLLLTAMCVGQMVIRPEEMKAMALRFVSAVALISLLAAPQILPFMDLLASSQRDDGFGAGTMWSMPAWGWANLLVPMFFSFEWTHGVFFQYDQYATSSYYPGIGIFALAILGGIVARRRRVWLIAAAVLICLILALGENTPIYNAIKSVFSPLGFMRYPVKFVLLTMLLLPALAAFGIARLQSVEGLWTKEWKIGAGVIVGFMVVVGIILYVAGYHPKYDGAYNRWPETLANGLSRGGLLIVMALVLVGALRATAVRQRWLCQLGMLLLVWADLYSHAPPLNPLTPRWVYEPGLVELDPPPRLGGPRLMTSPEAEMFFHEFKATNAVQDIVIRRKSLYSDLNLLDSIPKPSGYFPLHLGHTDRLITRLYQQGETPHPQLESFLGIAHKTSTTNLFGWDRRTNSLPLITGGQRVGFLADAECMEAILAPDFAPAKVVLLPSQYQAELSEMATNITRVEVQVESFSAHQIVCETEAAEPAMLVVAQSYYQNWHAFVDGIETPIYRANYAFQAIQIPAGKHRVEFRYIDYSFRSGVGLSLAGILLSMLIWARTRRLGAGI